MSTEVYQGSSWKARERQLIDRRVAELDRLIDAQSEDALHTREGRALLKNVRAERESLLRELAALRRD